MADYGMIASDIIDAAVGLAIVALSDWVERSYINLANGYYQLYSQQGDFYYNNFQANGELPLNTELFAVPFYVPLYSGANPSSSLAYFNPQLQFQTSNWQPTFQNHLNMFNSQDANPRVPSAVGLAEISDDWGSYYFRYEEHRRDVYNLRRYAQQMDSLSYGVKEAAMVERGLASSFAVFDEANGQLVSSINTMGNGIMGFMGANRANGSLAPAATQAQRGSNFDTSYEYALPGQLA